MGKFKTYFPKVQYLLLCLLAFCIPLNKKIVPPLIVITVVSFLLEGSFNKKFHQLKKQAAWFWLFVSLYLLHIASIFNSVNKPDAYFDLEQKLSILIFPIIFLSDINLSKVKINGILKFFIIGSFSSMLWLFVKALVHYSHFKGPSIFFYTGLADGMHPSYLSILYLFGIVLCILSYSQIKLSGFFVTVFLISSLFTIQMLNSRNGILATYIALALLFIYFIVSKTSHKYFIRHLVLIAVAPLVLFGSYKISKELGIDRISQAVISLKNDDTQSSTNVRLEIWKRSIDIVKTTPVFGVGTGDVNNELMKQYEEKGISTAKEYHLNAHNQYLQIALEMGIVGLLILLLILIVPLALSIRFKDVEYFLFIFIISFAFLTEVILNRQFGVVFYAFFNSLLFIRLQLNKQEN